MVQPLTILKTKGGGSRRNKPPKDESWTTSPGLSASFSIVDGAKRAQATKGEVSISLEVGGAKVAAASFCSVNLK